MVNNETMACAIETNSNLKSHSKLGKNLKTGLLAVAGVSAFILMSNSAMADGGNEIFGDIKDFVVTNMKGTLGSLISLSLILCGTFIAVKSQQFWAFIMGVVMAIGLYNSPTIVDNIMDDAGAGVNVAQVEQSVATYEAEGNQLFTH
ncbi:MAG: TraA family conjugative transfer protein [Succinivibrio sp.]|nr:TraA family conjugative transfer protein [Succinivibrio sp.]